MKLIQGSQEWIDWRMAGVGASEVPAILGVCPYNTANDIWEVKTKRKKGFEGNSFTEHGKETEAKARARYELTTMEDMPDACAIHPKFDVCRVSLDGLRADGKLILEIKCPVGRSTIDAAMAGEVPPHYWPQVQYQLAVTGAELAHFFVYHEASGDSALVEVSPDVKYQGEIIAKVLDFWTRYVMADVRPPLTDRDVKDITGHSEADKVANQIMDKTLPKAKLDELKAALVALGEHPKVRCGQVQVATVLRKGVFSFHKLTIREGATA